MTRPSPRRRPLRALATAAVLALVAAPASAAPAPKCGGRDMLAEMQRDEPQIHARIMAAAKATENTEAVLWRIEGRDGAPPSHLLGTVHVTDPRITTLAPAAKTALAQAKTVVLEVADLSPSATAEAITRAAPLILYADGRRLDTQLSPAEFATVKAKLAAAGMPGELGGLFKPWIVYMILSVSDCERQKVQGGDLVLDMRIAEDARARGVPVVGLETIDEQLAAMASVPDEQQLEVLKATLKYAPRTDDLMETVLQFYLQRRMGAAWPFQLALAAKAGIDPAPLATFRDELVVRRNLRMRDGLLPTLARGGAFVAVGAMHLVGREGLVTLLRQAGHTVTPVQ